jgi:hypothetical protein
MKPSGSTKQQPHDASTETSAHIIGGGKKTLFSSLQLKLLLGTLLVLGVIGSYVGYTFVREQTIHAASCVSEHFSQGDQGKCIRYIKQIVNAADIDVSLAVNGKYDKETKAAIKTFQEGVELTASGIVDTSTWYQLCEVANASVDELYDTVGCEKFEVDSSAGNTFHIGGNVSDDNSTPTQVSDSDSFSIVSMPDTQAEVNRDVKEGASPRGLVDKDMRWIVNNRNDRNIQVVVGPGDLTHAAAIGNNESVNKKIRKLWASISGSYKILDDAGIPYSITNGNHDTGANSLSTVSNSYGVRGLEKNKAQRYRDTSLFNETFPITRAGMKGLTLKDSDRVENSYRTFRVKNTNWLVIAMEYAPRREVLDWAKAIASSHAKYNIVIVTHAYMKSGSDTKLSQNCDATDCVSAQTIHDELVTQYPNVKLLFSGHTVVESTLVETAPSGNKVVQYRTTMHACMGEQPCRNPIRIVKIDLVNSTVTSELCLNVTASSAKDCTKKTTKGMQFVTTDQVDTVAPTE